MAAAAGCGRAAWGGSLAPARSGKEPARRRNLGSCGGAGPGAADTVRGEPEPLHRACSEGGASARPALEGRAEPPVGAVGL